MVCLMVLFFLQSRHFYCPTFQTFMVSVRGGGGGVGGQDLSISYLKQNCFSHGEGSFKESIHKQFYFRLMFLKTLALI